MNIVRSATGAPLKTFGTNSIMPRNGATFETIKGLYLMVVGMQPRVIAVL